MKKLKNKKSIIALFVYTLLYVLLFNEKLFANVSFNVNVNRVLQQEFTPKRSESINTFKFLFEQNSMSGPEGYCVNQQSNIYFLDTWTGQIKVFNKEGIFIKSFGEYGKFKMAKMIAVDDNNNFFIFKRWEDNPNTYMLRQFDNTFKFKKNLSFSKNSHSSLFLTFANKKLYITDKKAGELIVFGRDKEKEYIKQFPASKELNYEPLINKDGKLMLFYKKNMENLTNKKYQVDNDVIFIKETDEIKIGPVAVAKDVFIIIDTMNILKIIDTKGNILSKRKLQFEPISRARIIEGLDNKFYILGFEVDKHTNIRNRWLWKISLNLN